MTHEEKNTNAHSRDYDPTRLTWAALLGQWVEFARSAVALSTEGEGGRWRAAVPDLIALQAVWFALGELDELPADEKALGIDRAGVLVEKHAGALKTQWADAALPEGIAELIEDAKQRWQEAQQGV